MLSVILAATNYQKETAPDRKVDFHFRVTLELVLIALHFLQKTLTGCLKTKL